jgi:hypothetical protein
MSVGLIVTKQELDTKSGEIARTFQRLAGDVTTIKGYLDGTAEQVLLDFGYTANEIAVLKSGISDLAQLVVQIGYGQEGLAAPKDFTVFLRQLWGIGAY